VIGNYLPRQCGIATFTTDLCAAISAEYGTARLLALPVNDTEEGYDYPARVRSSLAQDDLRSYQQAAEFLNFNNIDMVCLQQTVTQKSRITRSEGAMCVARAT
jgi:hypothetical protein